jgi:secreted PhoX family phosphatase
MTAFQKEGSDSMTLSRRQFTNRSVAAGLGAVLLGSIDAVTRSAAAAPGGRTRLAAAPGGYGPLVDDPKGLLALPDGFAYKIVAQAGVTQLDSGHPTPIDMDGTASYSHPDGGSVLVNNHEISTSQSTPYPVPALDGFTYDPGAKGGTTTIRVNADGKRISEYASLCGTDNNCAGGRTPWNTWLSCEETESRAGQGTNTKDHGFVFEVDPFRPEDNRDPQALRFLGRYAHEALVVDPGTGAIYLTEDANGPHGLFYRWTPPSAALPLGRGSLRGLAGDPSAGKLEAMVCYAGGQQVPNLSAATTPGTTYDVRWVTVPDRLAVTTSVRKQFADTDVTRSRKLEGAWWGEGGAYFVSSYARYSDGSLNAHDGQVWFYDPQTQKVTLKLILAYDAVDSDQNFDGPDNITVSPYGGLMIAEDGNGLQHLFGAADDGTTYPMARNMINLGTAAAPAYSEFAGPTFSADGSLLFAGIQVPGIVFAISGPWKSQRV